MVRMKEDISSFKRHICRVLSTDQYSKFSLEPQVLRLIEAFGDHYGYRRPPRRLELVLASGTLVGNVSEEYSPYGPRFSVRDVHDRVVLWIEGPGMMWEAVADVVFMVNAAIGGYNVGTIVRLCKGYFDPQMYRSDTFEITFPIDQDVRLKAALVAATILIDSRFFEPSVGVYGCFRDFYY